MPPAVVEFWFEFASTYSHPAAQIVEAEAAEAGVAVRWRPFLLGPLFHAQQGLTDSPFNVQAAKGAYMWRDLERTCARLGVAWRRPSAFPRHSVLAARWATALSGAPELPAFAREVFRLSFAEDADIADPAVLTRAAEAVGLDPDGTAERAGSDTVKAALRAATDEALARGLFGAPSFITADGELFWGADRLRESLAWARAHPDR